MASSLDYHHDADALWQLYLRALRKSGSAAKGANPSQIPRLEANLYGAASDPVRVRRYAELCGFGQPLSYPVTWPHMLVFPLHLRLMTDQAFPLPLLGLVHLRNRIVQHRPLHMGEHLDIRCHIANASTTSRGLEFDLCSEAYSSGQLVWEEASTTLFRQKGTAVSGDKKVRSSRSLPAYSNNTPLEAPESIGRRYGRVSGDLNPIHLHRLSARAFGFPRAIAHGMWTKARCLGLLQQHIDSQSGPLEVDVSFKKPLFLPGKATLNWEQAQGETRFQLLNSKGSAPHLSGVVRKL